MKEPPERYTLVGKMVDRQVNSNTSFFNFKNNLSQAFVEQRYNKF